MGGATVATDATPSPLVVLGGGDPDRRASPLGEVATLLGIPAGTLQRWSLTGVGGRKLAVLKRGRLLLTSPAAVHDLIEALTAARNARPGTPTPETT
jgi:hypothetical protein